MADPISEEEKEHYARLRAEKDAKKRKCLYPGCDTNLIKGNESGYCFQHEKEKPKKPRKRTYRMGWKKPFFLAFARLEGEENKKVTRDMLEAELKVAVDDGVPVDGWLSELKVKSFIRYDNGSITYSRTPLEMFSDEEQKVVDYVLAAETLEEKKRAVEEKGRKAKKIIHTRIGEEAGLKVEEGQFARDEAVRKGYLEAIKPTYEVTLTQKGRRFLKECEPNEEDEKCAEEGTEENPEKNTL